MPSRIGLLVYWLVTGKLYGQDQPAKPIKVTVPRPSGHPFAPNVKPQHLRDKIERARAEIGARGKGHRTGK